MELKIKILDTPERVTPMNLFTPGEYDQTGFHIVEDSQGIKYLLHVNIVNSIVWSMDYESIKHQLEEIKEEVLPDFELDGPIVEVEGNVSESFALKMLAVSQGNVNFKDI